MSLDKGKGHWRSTLFVCGCGWSTRDNRHNLLYTQDSPLFYSREEEVRAPYSLVSAPVSRVASGRCQAVTTDLHDGFREKNKKKSEVVRCAISACLPACPFSVRPKGQPTRRGRRGSAGPSRAKKLVLVYTAHTRPRRSCRTRTVCQPAGRTPYPLLCPWHGPRLETYPKEGRASVNVNARQDETDPRLGARCVPAERLSDE